MAVFWIIHEWLLRLRHIRRQLADDARDGQTWMLRIRARILSFLVSRYSSIGEAEDTRRGAGSAESRTYCIVTPEDHPPRRCAELRGRLNSIRRINADKRPRWRWFL